MKIFASILLGAIGMFLWLMIVLVLTVPSDIRPFWSLWGTAVVIALATFIMIRMVDKRSKSAKAGPTEGREDKK